LVNFIKQNTQQRGKGRTKRERTQVLAKSAQTQRGLKGDKGTNYGWKNNLKNSFNAELYNKSILYMHFILLHGVF
jgi:hypothetical protein